jgi:hypothetical protein
MATPDPNRPDSLDMFEWEPTDFDQARAVHNTLPPGIEEVQRLHPNYWNDRRRPVLPSDRALTGCSLDWLIKLPELVRPKLLCERFPRIVNGLSETWHDNNRSVQMFEHLLHDKRTGRRGFPADVQREIERLCEYRISLG